MLIDPRNNLGHGVGLRSEHFHEILESKPKVDWFEAISVNCTTEFAHHHAWIGTDFS